MGPVCEINVRVTSLTKHYGISWSFASESMARRISIAAICFCFHDYAGELFPIRKSSDQLLADYFSSHDEGTAIVK